MAERVAVRDISQLQEKLVMADGGIIDVAGTLHSINHGVLEEKEGQMAERPETTDFRQAEGEVIMSESDIDDEGFLYTFN